MCSESIAYQCRDQLCHGKISGPLGLLSIATYLNSRGHTTRIYDRATDGTSLKTVCPRVSPGHCRDFLDIYQGTE
jgi:hypothetical protein